MNPRPVIRAFEQLVDDGDEIAYRRGPDAEAATPVRHALSV